MTDIRKLNRITSILLEILGDEDSIEVAAEHDELYLGGPNKYIEDKSVLDELESLGCTWNEGHDCWHVFT